MDSKIKEHLHLKEIFRKFDEKGLKQKDKALLFKELFEYIYQTKQVLKEASFRNITKSKIDYLINEKLPEDLMQILREPIQNLCKKIQEYEPKDAPKNKGCAAIFQGDAEPAAAAVAKDATPKSKIPPPPPSPKPKTLPPSPNIKKRLSEKTYKILGSGGYGIVFEPALPNIAKNGSLKDFPGNVTKVFYREGDLDGAINAGHKLASLMGKNQGHRFNTYKKKYKGKNLPDSLLENLKKDIPDLNVNNSLHLMRFPNLGTDIFNLVTTDRFKELRKIPLGMILEQILKLMRQTASLAKKKYLHADVRDRNIMVNTSTGVFTIVDFDWLMPYGYLYLSYSFPFYNNPPECMLLKAALKILKSDKKIDLDFIKDNLDKKDLNKYAQPIANIFNNVIAERGMENIEELKHILEEESAMNANYFREVYAKDKRYKGMREEDAIINIFLDKVFPTFDNFGLGFSLLELMANVYGTGAIWLDHNKEGMFDNYFNYLFTRITKYGKPYTEEEMKANVEAIWALSDLLHATTSFYLGSRPTAIEALEKMEKIVEAWRKVPRDATTAQTVTAAASKVSPTKRNNTKSNSKSKSQTRKNNNNKK